MLFLKREQGHDTEGMYADGSYSPCSSSLVFIGKDGRMVDKRWPIWTNGERD